MQETSDIQLLRAYAEHGHEAAFREIVSRHADVVYASALRQAGSPDLAHDIAQSVFTDLARKARSLAGTLSGDAALLGWLYRSTRFAALNQWRDDRRRHARERLAMQQLDPASETAPEWERVQPVLDEAMAELSDEDREALLLRFFKDRDFRAIGAALGISEDAAQKRVSRALERLHTGLTSRGVTTTAGALSALLVAETVSFAPAGLAATLSTAALAGTTLATTATATATKAIAMTTLQKTLIAATLAAAVGTGIYEARQASTLRNQVQTLQQQAPLAGQIEQVTRERDDATRRLAGLRDDNERLKRDAAELLRLRGEVARLKNTTRTSTKPEQDEIQAQWAAWVSQMRTNVVKPEDAAYLVQALTNKATRIRLEATWAMRNIGLQRLFDTNLTSEADLERQDLELQQATKIVVPALVKTLNDSDALVRANAALTLGFLREELDLIVPALAAALNDQDNRVALSAAKALGRFQRVATNAIPALLQTAHSSDPARRDAAINALKQIDADCLRKAGLD